MNRQDSSSEDFERQHRAIAGLRLEQNSDEQTQKAVVAEAALKAIMDIWPEMPEDDRNRVVSGIVGYEALNFQLAVFRRGWATGQSSQRIQLDPEVAGPRILVRAYATAEADATRMKKQAGGQTSEDGQQLTLEEKMRRYLRPNG